jgi:adenylosuccinate lyase
VYESASYAFENKISLKESLMRNETIIKSVSEVELDELLDPIRYTGICEQMINSVLNKSKSK